MENDGVLTRSIFNKRKTSLRITVHAVLEIGKTGRFRRCVAIKVNVKAHFGTVEKSY